MWTLLSPGEMGEELTTIYPLRLSINWAISQAETRSDNASKQTAFLRPKNKLEDFNSSKMMLGRCQDFEVFFPATFSESRY